MLCAWAAAVAAHPVFPMPKAIFVLVALAAAVRP